MPHSSASAEGISQAHTGAARPIRLEQKKLEATPFPWMAMVAISTCLVAHAYALCNLFPYVGYMVRYLGATEDKDQAGYYAGYLSSALMIGRFAGAYSWGRLADRFGRMPVMYLGLVFMAVLSVAFGFSTNFFWAVSLRLLTGLLNGIVANSKTMISEICGSEHEVVGMSFVTGCWSVGLVLGSGLGGLLAEPAIHYPTMFSESGLFGRFPYLLPNIFGAALSVAALPLVYFFIEETLDVQKGSGRHGFEPIPTAAAELHVQEAAMVEGGVVSTTCLDNGYDPQLNNGRGGGATSGSGGHHERELIRSNGNIGGSSAQARVDEKLPLARQPLTSPSGAQTQEDGGGRNAFLRECLLPFKLLEEKRVRTIIFVHVLLSFVNFGAQDVYPLWALSTFAKGGLDWTTKQIGQALSVCGGSMLVFQLFIYPQLVTQIGPTRSQRWSCCIAIPAFLSYPLLPLLHDSGSVLLAASVAVLFLTSVAANAVVINVALTINNAVHPSQRGSLNGVAMMLGSLAKAAGPIFSSTMFAWSISHRRPFPMDCHFIFFLFAIGMVVVTAMSWNIDISPIKSEPEGADASPAVAVAGDAPERSGKRV